MSAPLLRWDAAPRGAYRGYLGTVKLFSIEWGLIRVAETPWDVRCWLPGYVDRNWRVADERAGEALAEKVLARWLERTGLVAK